MKPITKSYLKIFLLTGIPYGFIMLGFDLADGNEFRLWKFLLSTFSFGIPMSLILVSSHRYRHKKNGIQEMTNDNEGVFHTKNVKSKINLEELFKKLKTDPIIGKMKMKEIEDGIQLKTNISWKSWGEEIKIILKNHKETDFEYQISSSPKLKTTLIDYGKNFENVTRIENIIKNIV